MNIRALCAVLALAGLACDAPGTALEEPTEAEPMDSEIKGPFVLQRQAWSIASRSSRAS